MVVREPCSHSSGNFRLILLDEADFPVDDNPTETIMLEMIGKMIPYNGKRFLKSVFNTHSAVRFDGPHSCAT
jgi:hypothetical protein